MANAMQKKSTVRKVIYICVIAVLFTITLYWRGKIILPLAKVGQPLEPIAKKTILLQSKDLELLEEEQGDSDIIGSAMSVSLSGMKGLAVTLLWKQAIDNQKKSEFHDLEQKVRLVTKLQPNFRVPWLFQSWNLAYNVSVENERLNDMFFYISRGIELLAEGERLNKKSPDMRSSVGFYYQNKFGVSDKVVTLRSLMQLSCIPHTERNPANFTKADGSFNSQEFEKFCDKNPQLVRRLREKLDCRRPEQVVQFLKDNTRIPSRYIRNSDILNENELQFPILPIPTGKADDEAEKNYIRTREYHGESQNIDDSFDAFIAAREWNQYAQVYLPPPASDDETKEPVPTGIHILQGQDLFKYRIPKSPALIIFRAQPARSQTYLAERLMKEGWNDKNTVWRPDEFRDSSTYWFKDGNKELKATDNAQAQWEKSYEMWSTYGKDNAMILSNARMQKLQDQANGVDTGNNSAKEKARRMLQAYDQNLNMTNFTRFLSMSQAEKQNQTINARRLMSDAERYESQAEYAKALDKYVESLNEWRQVLLENPLYHRSDRSQQGEEDYYELMMKMANLQVKQATTGEDKKRLDQYVQTATGFLGGVASHEGTADLNRLFAEDLIAIKVTAKDSAVKAKVSDSCTAVDAAMSGLVMAFDDKSRSQPIRTNFGVKIVNSKEFIWKKDFKEANNPNEPWVNPFTIESVRTKLNLVRKLPVPGAEGGEGGTPPEVTPPATMPGRPMP